MDQMNEIPYEQQQSFLSWMFRAMGPLYGLLIPMAGLAIFAAACLVVASNRRPAVIAAFLVFLPLPLMIGLFGTLHGFISSFTVMATAGSTPKPSELAEGIAMGLFTAFVGLLVTFPSYFVLAFGLFLRTLTAKSPAAELSDK